ncbi:MAG: hypothetical protein EZS28_016016 [Streblomastix strix]|uniref:Uncharacterized protein n=1 Tax=Streblomastix strix TaxID=222440 RepID=A0A5J4W1Q4_9EUKA|nr:MAG: hypothetical protein EZS28_016016 [Streblomastix strix]
MITKLRAGGATQADISAFTRHPITSNVVDAYYYCTMERDLDTLLIKALFKQQQDLDDVEQQLEASEGNATMQSHLVKQIKQRTYTNAIGKNSSVASATAASISTASPNLKK